MRWCNILSTPPITPTSIHQSKIFGNKCLANKEGFGLWPDAVSQIVIKCFMERIEKWNTVFARVHRRLALFCFEGSPNVNVEQILWFNKILISWSRYRLFTMRESTISKFFRALPVAKETNFTSNSVKTSLWPWRIATNRENFFDFDTILDLPCVLSLSLKISGGLLL